jgi:hypothetical protein
MYWIIKTNRLDCCKKRQLANKEKLSYQQYWNLIADWTTKQDIIKMEYTRWWRTGRKRTRTSFTYISTKELDTIMQWIDILERDKNYTLLLTTINLLLDSKYCTWKDLSILLTHFSQSRYNLETS